jgi:hypothetical protein
MGTTVKTAGFDRFFFASVLRPWRSATAKKEAGFRSSQSESAGQRP